MDAEQTRVVYWCYGAVGRDSQRGISTHILDELFSSCIYSLVTVQLSYTFYRSSDSNTTQFSRHHFLSITGVTPNSCPSTCLFVDLLPGAVNNTLSRRFFLFISLTVWRILTYEYLSYKYFRLLLFINPLPRPLMYLTCHHGVLRRQHHFVDHAILFRSQPQSQEFDIRLTYRLVMAPSIFVYGSKIQVLYQHFIRFVVRSDDLLDKYYGRSAGGKDYDCLILPVHETTDHCLKSNVCHMLSAAISFGSYILTISDSYLLPSWTLLELCLSEL